MFGNTVFLYYLYCMEKWKKIQGLEHYEVSESGLVRSLDRVIIGKNGGKYFKPSKVLSPKTDRYGYQCVHLRHNGESKHTTVHRLVANAFIDKVEGKNTINHKNGNKKDNTVDNLEWLTIAENNKHAYVVLNRRVNWNRVGTSGSGAIRNKKVKMITPDKKEVVFYSIRNAANETGIHEETIARILRGKAKQMKNGYIFENIN